MTLEWLRRRDAKFSAELEIAAVHERLDRRAGGGRTRTAAAAPRRPAARRLARHRQPEGRSDAVNNLHRELAPISARRLAARSTRRPRASSARSSPAASWSTSSARTDPRTAPSTSAGCDADRDGPVAGVERGAPRRSLPLVELRAAFDAVARRARRGRARRADPDLDAAHRRRDPHRAGRGHARSSTATRPAGIRGIERAHAAQADRDPERRTTSTRSSRRRGDPHPAHRGRRRTVRASRSAPAASTGLIAGDRRGGYPVLEGASSTSSTARWCGRPAVNGAVVLSTRGGDFELTVGRDLSIGYASHDAAGAPLPDRDDDLPRADAGSRGRARLPVIDFLS